MSITLLGNVAVPLAGLVTAPVLAQSLGVDGRGTVAAAIAPTLLAVSLVTLGLPEALTYYSTRISARWRAIVVSVLFTLAGTGAVSVGIIAALAMPLAAGVPGLDKLMVLASMIVVPTLIQTALRGIAAGRRAWWRITFERITNSTARMVTVVALALTDSLDITTGTIAMAFSTCVGLIAYVRLPRRQTSAAASPHAFSNVISYGSRIWLGSLSGVVLARLDQTLMVVLASTYDLGLYVVAVTVSEMVLVVNSSIRDVVFAIESGGTDDNRIAAASRVSTLITACGCIAIGLLSIWAVPFFFGEDFAGAIPLIWVLSLGIVLGNPGSVAGIGLTSRGRPGLRSVSLAIAALCNVAILIVLTPLVGAMGAALATVAGNIVAGLLNVIWMNRYCGVPMSSFYGIRSTDVRTAVAVVHRFISRGKFH
ncbi:lipopolysaccharide biosynthesis protein [Paramicrobacterium chengjingii]|uniref:Oligosaccharide flippase family protein n=1 Tax=Paramicrobacterium chengjingii TaxID=2769067 RepID=A0ABX6YFW3_9MICO|nr:oligosaccharide flippase family protein [Microbacterium chengjingii]QPZ37480.1 oligosaccharide flippase family protein [Microbacterium chengjingii]